MARLPQQVAFDRVPKAWRYEKQQADLAPSLTLALLCLEPGGGSVPGRSCGELRECAVLPPGVLTVRLPCQ